MFPKNMKDGFSNISAIRQQKKYIKNQQKTIFADNSP